jgi:hypothetical protein
MRRTLLGLLVIFLLWSPAAYPKDKEVVQPLPVFMDPDFHFSQVETICVAPTLDLRADKKVPAFLAGQGASSGWFSHFPSADKVVVGQFNNLGYTTIACKPVNASLSDLTGPSEAWLHGLDFGSTKWLFVSAVEDVSTKTTTFLGSESVRGFEGGHAVVSGYLFAKQADVVKLVWRDRAFGERSRVFQLAGSKSGVEDAESAQAVTDAMLHLIWRFERRSNKRAFLLFSVAEENFDAACSTVWPALKGAFDKDPKKYKVAFLDDSDRMALYTKNNMMGFQNEDHVVLRDRGGSCVMQFTQAFLINEHRRTDDWSDLIKEVRASISK